MGNKNSSSSRSTKNIANHNQVYIEAINEYEVTLEAATKASNTSKVGPIIMDGKRNVMNVNVQQKANVANYIAASAAIQSVLDSDADVNSKFEALTGLYNDAIQSGGLLSNNSSEAIDETNITNENYMNVCNKLSNAISIVSSAVAENSSEIGTIMALSSAEENVLNLNIQQEATAFASTSNQLFADYANQNGLTFKDLNKTETTEQNKTEQTGNVAKVSGDVADTAQKISGDVAETAKKGMDIPANIVSQLTKPVIYIVIGVVAIVVLILVYKFLMSEKHAPAEGGFVHIHDPYSAVSFFNLFD